MKVNKGTIYIVSLDIEKISRNRSDRFENWVLLNDEGQYEPLFNKKILSSYDKFEPVKSQGDCCDIGSYFFCAMKKECSTNMF